MTFYIVKIVVTTALIVLISEIAKRSSFAAALLASIPLVSVLAMVWLYIDTKDVAKVSSLATSVFWLVLPSLVLFVVLPLLLQYGINFYLSLAIAIAITITSYGAVIAAAARLGINL